VKQHSKREKTLLSLTIVIALVGILLQTGAIDYIQNLTTSSGQLDNELATYRKNQEQLSRREFIEKQYKEIEDQFPALEKGQKPEHVFSEDIDRLCKTLGFNYPVIEPPDREDIENVDEYQFITLQVRTSGNLDSIAKLLKGFAEKKLIIKEITLRSTLDSDVIHAVIKLARIAKVDKEEEAKKQKKKVRKWKTTI